MSPVGAAARGPVIQAAGAIVWRERAGRLEVALVHRPRYRDWSWPKGKLDPGEALPAAAAREVAEETGVPVILGTPLPAMHYRIPEGTRKHVRYWAARVATDDDAPALGARAPVHRAPLTEIDDVVWVSSTTAADLLTRASDRRPLAAVEDLRARGRLTTRVLVVARHGRARQRSAWNGDEATRPLTAQGGAQAAALVGVLAAFGVREIVTSPWERCVRTVAAYAERSGLGVHTVEALTEAAHAADPQAALRTCSELLLHPRDAVLVTHRPVLPAVVEVIGEATRRWTTGRLPADDPYLRTGEVMVVHVAGVGRTARVVAVELHRPGLANGSSSSSPSAPSGDGRGQRV